MPRMTTRTHRTHTPRHAAAAGSGAASLLPRLVRLEAVRPDSLKVVEGYVNQQLGIARRLETRYSRSE